jgi:hypothetical protein
MKKIFMFAVAALALAACTSDDVALQQAPAQQDATPVNFDVYVPRTVTRAGAAGNQGGVYGITTASLSDPATEHGKAGFGVFGYYTSNGEYDTNNSTPNYMYNQQVKHSNGTSFLNWTYEPVKYWPNEYGDAAKSDDLDHVTFFAYAPWVDVTVNTGVPVSTGTTPEEKEQEQKLNITQITKNTETGDPVIKYVVDTKPNTSVDLLWGVAAADAQVIDMAQNPQATPGNTFLNITKPGCVTNDQAMLKWNFKHALAMLNVQIVMAVDTKTGGDEKPGSYTGASAHPLGTEGDASADKFTKVFLRHITFDGGFAMQGALNLHSEDVDAAITDPAERVRKAVPNWKDYDGTKELQFAPVTFYDGLKDGKEGTTNNIQKNEKPQGLNPILLEKATETTWEDKAAGIPTNAFVNLFDGATNATDPIYVIPSGEKLNVEILYDVLTQDEKLAGLLSDAKTHGSAIENKIYKEDVFGGNIEAGKRYTLKIIVGLESVKFEAVVSDCVEGYDNKQIVLPEN